MYFVEGNLFLIHTMTIRIMPRLKKFKLPKGTAGGQMYHLIHEGLWSMVRDFGSDFTAGQVAENAGITEKTALRHLMDFNREGRVRIVGRTQRILYFRITDKPVM
jgi:hypothetical protein